MTNNILQSMKESRGNFSGMDLMDSDFLIVINSAFLDLNTVGAGPVEGFEVSEETTWTDYVEATRRSLQKKIKVPIKEEWLNEEKQYAKMYVRIKVWLGIDPPAGSLLTAVKDEEHRLAYLIASRRDALMYKLQNERQVAPDE